LRWGRAHKAAARSVCRETLEVRTACLNRACLGLCGRAAHLATEWRGLIARPSRKGGLPFLTRDRPRKVASLAELRRKCS
jgi:hypothetical protein